MAGGTRAVRNVSAGAVTAIAAWSSYSHMVHVALNFGERPEVAYALPFSVDGMLVVASVVMVDDKRRNHRVRPIARLAFAAGVLASVAANIAAAHSSIGARIVAAWPAVALLLVVEMLARPPVPAAAEVPPSSTAQMQPPAEGVAAGPSFEHVPVQVPPSPAPARSAPAKPSAHLDRQPPAAAHRRRPIGTGPTGTATPAHDRGHREAAGLPTAPARSLSAASPDRPVAVVTPLAVVPPAGSIDLPPELRAEVPQRSRSDVPAAEAAATAVDRGRRTDRPRAQPARRRRPTAATRQLAQQIIAAEPHLSRTEVAARLGVSTRRLREVLATPT
ncbi:DUF2637 domain-containing protein [Rhizomonospora bruguierae]|uniref:DUF2637 domain-containing protein n=1 Tax=Rhizomonospora bruguierae TaxID=1581705 RepID=UPI001BCB593D|nr:DUF2637 domain-containing protein [Micromonospora sp. NBRC 107566]